MRDDDDDDENQPNMTDRQADPLQQGWPGSGITGPMLLHDDGDDDDDEGAGRAERGPAVQPLDRPAARSAVVLSSHTAVDVYSALIPPIIGLLEVRCNLSGWQTASLLGIGSVSSGLAQPIAAWLSDRFDTRIFAALGLVLAAVCLSFIGSATSYVDLLVLFVIGMIGVGMYHPVGASSIGQIADGGARSRRSLMISIFFVAGMIGGIGGSLIAPAVVSLPDGFTLLRVLAVPGLLLAAVLHVAIRRVPHRHADHRSIRLERRDLRHRWTMITILYISSAMRFTVNIALYYLFVRYAQQYVMMMNQPLGVVLSEQQVADAAAPINGWLNAATIAGMACGGLIAGSLIRAGREKLPMVWVPICVAPTIVLLPLFGPSGAMMLAFGAGVGFAAMVPVSIALGQRLLPHRTSLASGLMLGGAWSVALVGPLLAEWCLHTVGLSIEQTFMVVAALLAASGLVGLLLDRELLQRTAG